MAPHGGDTIVGRVLDPWNQHDIDGTLAPMPGDCVWEISRGREPHGTLCTGWADVRAEIVEASKALLDVN